MMLLRIIRVQDKWKSGRLEHTGDRQLVGSMFAQAYGLSQLDETPSLSQCYCCSSVPAVGIIVAWALVSACQ